MTASVILAIDQGTTNTKAVIVDQQGTIQGKGVAPVPIEHPQPGWIQQAPEAIWHSVLSAISNCLQSLPPQDIAGLGISNQRESVVIWEHDTGTPIGPAITWQCRRTTEATNALKKQGVEAEVMARTGLPLDPLFPALKIKWLLNQAPSSKKLCAGTIDSWLIWKLTEGAVHATDQSNAARTQLLNLQTGTWDPHLCSLFGVPLSVLPHVCDSQHIFGHTCNVQGLPDGIPIGSAIGDSHAALFGHVATNPGDAKITFGTGSSIMAAIPSFQVPTEGVTTTIAWSIGGVRVFAYEGNILVSASLFPWLAQTLGLGDDVGALMELAGSVEDSKGCYLVPAMVGLGAPHWNPEARGLISGLNFNTSPAHIARAGAESLAFQVVDVMEMIYAQAALPQGRIVVDGGPSQNPLLMQIVADCLGSPLEVGNVSETSALGTAYLTGMSLGIWNAPEDLESLKHHRTTIYPKLSPEKHAKSLLGWRDAVKKCTLPAANDSRK